MMFFPNMDQTLRRGLILGLVVGSVFVVGVLGYTLIEGWNFFDALYMTVITFGTVGYSETHDLSTAGRAFTIVLILGGTIVTIVAAAEVTAFIVEGEMTGALRKRKLMKQIEHLHGHFILCGMGRTGNYVLQELLKTKREVVVIEDHEDKAKVLIDQGIRAIVGDATNDEILVAAGIERAAGLMSSLPSDRDNMFVVISARALNKKLRIVSRIEHIEARQKFIHSGADSGVSTHFIGGMRMASELIRPTAVTFLDKMLRSHGDLRVEEAIFAADSKFVGQRLGDLKIFEQTGTLLMASVNGEDIHFNPPHDQIITAGSGVIIMGSPEQVIALKEKMG